MAARLTARQHQVPDDPEAVFEYAIAQGWSDGLPLIPPTPERVERMLASTARTPQAVVARLDPRQGEATVERIAVNAVMAGCAPAYLPVLLAAVEAVADPAFNLNGIQATTNPVGPLLIVNGPVRRQIGINAGRNALGPGCRANATIGRALRLCLLNIGGAVPGEVDKAILGMPGKYTFCLGEHEEDSPWEPLHAERGFGPQESAVTAVGVQGTSNVLVLSGHAEDALRLTADAMATMGHNNVLMGRGNPVVVFSPGHARLLAEQGFRTKAAVRRFLFEHARIPADRFPPREVVPTHPLAERAIVDGQVCAVREPDDLLVVVAGGPEPYHITCCPSFGDTRAVTRKVEAGPAGAPASTPEHA
jgi:hypothetical protein